MNMIDRFVERGGTLFDQRIWRAIRELIHKECRRFLRIWMQTLLPPVITSMLYFLILGRVLGAQIELPMGIDYAQFMVPGLVITAVMTNACSNVSSSFFSAKLLGSIEELLVAPLPHWVIITGFAAAGALRGVITGAAIILTSTCFVSLTLHSLSAVMLTMLLAAVLFSLMGLISALYSKSYDELSLFSTLILTPLSYLSGCFYSKSMLAVRWQRVFAFNPIAHIVDGIRFGFFGLSEFSFKYTMIGLCCAIILSGVTASRLLQKNSMRV